MVEWGIFSTLPVLTLGCLILNCNGLEKIGKSFACIESNITVNCKDGKFVYASIKGGISSSNNCSYSDGDCTGSLIGTSKLDDCMRSRDSVCVVTLPKWGDSIFGCDMAKTAKATYFYLEDITCTKDASEPILDICENTNTSGALRGFIHAPAFPSSYKPKSRDCHMTIPVPPYHCLKVESVFVDLKDPDDQLVIGSGEFTGKLAVSETVCAETVTLSLIAPGGNGENLGFLLQFEAIPHSNVSDITTRTETENTSSSTMALTTTTENPDDNASTVSRAPPGLPHAATSLSTLASVVAMLIARTIYHA